MNPLSIQHHPLRTIDTPQKHTLTLTRVSTKITNMTFKITFSWPGESEQHSFQCDEDTYLLDAAEAAGFEWPYSARAGVEPSTAARLISGEVDQIEQSFLSDNQISKGFILADVAYPLSDCTLIIGVEDDDDMY
jgi:ferredoxin